MSVFRTGKSEGHDVRPGCTPRGRNDDPPCRRTLPQTVGSCSLNRVGPRRRRVSTKGDRF